jgi:serine protease AprX
MKTRTWTLGEIALTLLLVGSAARAEMISDVATNLSGDLQAVTQMLQPGAMVDVIVGSNGPLTAQEQLRIQLFVLSLGGTVKAASFSSFSGYACSVPASKVNNLGLDRASHHLVLDRTIRPTLDVALPTIGAEPIGVGPSDPVATMLNHLNVGIGQPVSPTGAGVTVAVIDSGIAANADLRTSLGLDRVILRWSAVAGSNTDEFGHGTHVAGIIGGNGNASSGAYATRTFRGVAPDVRLISMKVLGSDGSGEVSNVLQAVDWILANRTLYHIRVVNMSLGHPVVETCDKDPLCQAVEAMNAAGIVVVVSAGNWGTLGYGSVTSPGVAPDVITVGAAKDMNSCAVDDDDIASYSSRGQTWPEHILKPDVVAPGNRIISLRVPGGYLDTHFQELRVPTSEYSTDPFHQNDPGAYFELSGTSMAAPIVTGMIAQMLEADGSLTPATVKARLMASAHKIGRSPTSSAPVS